jgi:transcription-repair coupling factor (superfamily II helicase)
MPQAILPSGGLPTEPSDHRRWGNIDSGAAPYLIHALLNQSESFCLLIARDSQQAYTIEQGLEFFNQASETKHEILVFPDWETLPYDSFSPHEDIISHRLETLNRLPHATSGILIIPLPTLLHRLPPVDFLQGNSLSLKTGQNFDIDNYRRQLESVGYRHVDTVYEHGEYTVRGAIFDIFPMGSEVPVRIELFDDEIDSLRTFDPETQRSIKKLNKLNILPAHEFPWDAQSRMQFRNRWLEQFPNSASNSPVIRDIKEAIKPHGIEYYGPLFFDQMANLFDYLPADTLVLTPANTSDTVVSIWNDINSRYEDRRYDIQRPILAPQNLFLKVDEFFSLLKHFPQITLESASFAGNATSGQQDLAFNRLKDVAIDDRATDPLSKLKTCLSDFNGKTLIIAESAGRREVLTELFQQYSLAYQRVKNWPEFTTSDAAVNLTFGSLSHGFVSASEAFQVITETELFGQRVMQTRRRKKSSDNSELVIKNLTELRIGSPVVHIDNGVGRYRGLETIEIDGQKDEFLMLEYASEAKLYVPISSLNLISRYSGTDESLAPLHRLGTEKWSVAKQKALEKIRDTAAELLEVYAKREARSGFANEKPGQAYRAFCSAFPFEETPDQQNTIKAVINDMTRPQPMDRLVCGDVGFGKTEVAMRAAFIATHSGKQVAVLVPTTLLAQQHYESFQDRFADTPVKVEVLSRFNSSKEQAQALKNITEGKADIVIGTHKLIQQDIRFKDLGLLIIDEEHRFGVQQKERIKAYRAEVDILTLTATPIPRTLNMAMGGIRDLSIIATPPAKRLSVKTFVREKENSLIKESLLREILRGGQVYYLFNDVKNIEKEAAFLKELIPEARIGIAHGQMRERELEQAMSDFYHMRFNVLVCSTIIETGIDIPNANTIIIDRADKFGLAQLHQLRGRVGRSHHQAYAYLLTSAEKKLSTDAEKRLEAIVASQELGAGFMLATHDLEIRGAGELLGEEQSGQIQNIGYTLYMELLEQAVKSLQEGKSIELDSSFQETEIKLRIPAIIPDDYLADVHMRLVLYKRIASARSNDALKEIQVEMIDRFGLLPEPIKNLMRQTELKLRAEKLGILKIDAGASSGRIEFSSNTSVDPLAIVQLVQQHPDRYRLEGATKLKFELDASDADKKLSEIDDLLKKLEGA